MDKASLAWSLLRRGLWDLVANPAGWATHRGESVAPKRSFLRSVFYEQAPNRLFDGDYYLRTNPDVAATGMSPFLHFVRYGSKEGRDPHPLFSSSFYLGSNPEARRHPGGALGHFLGLGARQRRNPHPLFDTSFYLESLPGGSASGINPLLHFLYLGDAQGYSPHPLFDNAYYRATNETVASSGMNALEHFLLYGGQEGRNPHPLFDCSYYRATAGDRAKDATDDATGPNPLVEFLELGAVGKGDPHPLFDCAYYVRSNDDVSFDAVNPLVHFVLRGAREGRSPHPDFDIAAFCEQNEVDASVENPLVRFLQTGDRLGSFSRATELRLLARHRRYELEPSEVEVGADLLLPIHDTGAFISGWVSADSRVVETLRLRSATGHETADFLSAAARAPRDDASSLPGEAPVRGFDAFVRDPSLVDGRSYLSLVASWSGEASSSHWLNFDRGGLESQLRALLAALQARLPYYAGSRTLRRVLDEHFGPAVELLAARRERCVVAARELIFGSPLVEPMVSIVVPVYGRLDLIEHQLALFANDGALAAAELIYVLDDPELEQVAPVRCGEWHRLYRVPFRLLSLGRNRGFSTACNVGAAYARSPLLLFLNSDVMPKDNGWLGKACDAFHALPEPGVMGVRLLWEDESIQHDGLGFVKDADHELWVNIHPLKGLASPGNASSEPFEVPAVTGAALMIEGSLFEELDGFDDGYIIGGYEDSDLCLRALKAGKKVWMAPAIELYHLEGKSQDLHCENANTPARMWYNAWRQDRRHGGELTLMAQRERYRSRNLSWIRSEGWGEPSDSDPWRERPAPSRSTVTRP